MANEGIYHAYPIVDAMRQQLSWTHYRILLSVNNASNRKFYETECINSRWSTRELERQIGSFLYETIAASRDASGLIRLATHSAEPFQPTDLLRDPYVLEFTGLPERGEWRSVIWNSCWWIVCKNFY